MQVISAIGIFLGTERESSLEDQSKIKILESTCKVHLHRYCGHEKNWVKIDLSKNYECKSNVFQKYP